MNYRKKVSKPRASGLDFSIHSGIWQASRQQRCRDACHISKRYDHYNTQSHGLETSRDFAVRRLTSPELCTRLTPLFVLLWFGTTQIYTSELHHIKHIEAETKWPTYRRRLVRMHFVEWKYISEFRLIFHWILFLRVKLTICIVSDNGLAPARRQSIIRTNDGKLIDA